MDGVLADVEAHALNLYEAQSGIRLSKSDILGRTEEDMLPDGLFRKLIHQKNFFRNLPVMKDAIESIQTLSKEYDIYIVSAAVEFPLSLEEKHDWLAEHFPFISWKNIIFCGNKHVIQTDYMIDDHPKNLDVCLGKPVMFSAFHNMASTHARFDDWKAVLSYFESEAAHCIATQNVQ